MDSHPRRAVASAVQAVMARAKDKEVACLGQGDGEVVL